MLLYKLIKLLSNNNEYVLSILSITLIIIETFLIINIINNSKIVREETFISGYIYLLIMFALPNNLIPHPVIFANLFLLLSLREIFILWDIKNNYSNLFNTGIYVSISSLFYLPSAITLIFVYLSLIVYTTYKWREWVIPLMGFLLPYLYVFLYYYFINDIRSIENIFSSFKFTPHLFLPENKYQIIYYIFIVIITLIGIFSLLNHISEGIIKIRKYKSIILMLSLTVILIIILYGWQNYKINYFSIPLTFLLTHYLLLKKKKKYMEEIILFLFTCIVILNYINHLF